jgi:stage II sporulation protein E
MLDKIEIYPYQRISETTENTKPRRKRILRTPTLKIPDLSRQHVINFLRLLLNWPNLVLVFTSLFLARASILGELFPFVFAFVASFAYEKKLPALLLVVAGTAGFASCLEGFYLWQNLSALIVLAIIIHTVTVPGRITKWALPLLTASILIVTKSIALLFWQINLYQEMIIIFESILTAMLTFVFLICNKVFIEKKALEEFTFEEITALVILCTGLLLGVNNVYILNFSISSILCRWAILSAAFLWGSGAGTMMGVMAGIIPSLASSIFSQALAMYAIAGLLAGLFRLIGRIGSIIGFMLAVLAFSFFTASNEPALIYIQESIISSTLFFFSINYFKGKLPFIKFTTANALESSSALPIEKHYQEYTQNQIHHLAQVFDELSASFVGQATSTPGYASEGYLNFLYESIASQLCKKCPRYEACWQRDCYNTSQELLNLFTLAEKQTQLSYNDCPPSLKKKCIFAEE